MTREQEQIEQIESDYIDGEIDDIEFEERLEEAMGGTYNPYQHHTPDMTTHGGGEDETDVPTPWELLVKITHALIGLLLIVLMLAEPAIFWLVVFLVIVDHVAG